MNYTSVDDNRRRILIVEIPSHIPQEEKIIGRKSTHLKDLDLPLIPNFLMSK